MTIDEIRLEAAAAARADAREVAEVPSVPRPEMLLEPLCRAIGLEGASRAELDEAWDAYRNAMGLDEEPPAQLCTEFGAGGSYATAQGQRLGRVGDCVLRLDMNGQRRELLVLGVDVLTCIAQIDRRLAPRSGR